MKIRDKLYKQFIKSKNNQTRNIHGLDKYNTMFQNVKRVLHQNKAHTKIS